MTIASGDRIGRNGRDRLGPSWLRVPSARAQRLLNNGAVLALRSRAVTFVDGVEPPEGDLFHRIGRVVVERPCSVMESVMRVSECMTRDVEIANPGLANLGEGTRFKAQRGEQAARTRVTWNGNRPWRFEPFSPSYRCASVGSTEDTMRLLFLTAATSCLALAACNQERSPEPVDAAQDAAAGPVGQVSAATLGSNLVSAYVPNAAMGDLYEIQAADLAIERSQNAQVKDLARMIRTDHTAASENLKAVAPQAAPEVAIP